MTRNGRSRNPEHNGTVHHASTVQSRFLEPPRETKISSRNREVREIGVALETSLSKGNENWFEKSGGSRNRGFEKSGSAKGTKSSPAEQELQGEVIQCPGGGDPENDKT